MRVPGFEPGTYRVSVDCSSQLSYTRTKLNTNSYSLKVSKWCTVPVRNQSMSQSKLTSFVATPPRTVVLWSCDWVPTQSHSSQLSYTRICLNKSNCFDLLWTNASRSYVFLPRKTSEAGSWKFQFGETEIIPDHNTIHNQITLPKKRYFNKKKGGVMLMHNSRPYVAATSITVHIPLKHGLSRRLGS